MCPGKLTIRTAWGFGFRLLEHSMWIFCSRNSPQNTCIVRKKMFPKRKNYSQDHAKKLTDHLFEPTLSWCASPQLGFGCFTKLKQNALLYFGQAFHCHIWQRINWQTQKFSFFATRGPPWEVGINSASSTSTTNGRLHERARRNPSFQASMKICRLLYLH